MNVYVQLNDVLDETTPTVMEWRVKHAFGTDGTDFWQNFFFCDKVHEDERVIYLFTEYQLQFLLNWWETTMRTCDKNTQKNLDYSLQKLLIGNQAGKEFNEIRACYILDDPGSSVKDARLNSVHFGVQPSRYLSGGGLRNIDFFKGQFNGEQPDPAIKEVDGRYRKKIVYLLNTRSTIAKEFGGPPHDIFYSVINIFRYKYKSWLRYLAPKHNTNLKIDYCVDIDPNCPLVKRIF
jgi:hypothetical protein